MSSPSPPRETSLPPGWRPGWPVFAANPDARLVLVDGDATDFTEANLDVALRLAEGPGDLQGVASARPNRWWWARANGSPGPAIRNRRAKRQKPRSMWAMPGRRSARRRRGWGVRVPLLLAQGWRELGRIPGFGTPEPSRRGYWLVAPTPQWRQKKVKALVAHLTA
jgi:LysR family glycine cleavage system transcriptional activator